MRQSSHLKSHNRKKGGKTLKQKVSTIILLFTAVFFGFGFIFQTVGAKYGIDTFTFNAVRFTLGSLLLVPIVRLLEKERMDAEKKKRLFFASFACGSALFVCAALQQYGAAVTGNPGKSGFLSGLYMVIIPFLNFLVFRKKPGGLVWISAGLAATGVFFLCFEGGSFSTDFGIGETALLVSSFCWAVHILMIDRFAGEIGPLKLACGQFFVCGMFNFLAEFFSKGSLPPLEVLSAGKWILLASAVFSVALGFTGQVVGQSLSDDPTKASIIVSSESLFSVLLSLVWNLLPIGEHLKVETIFHAYGAFGGLLMLFAILLSQIPAKETEEPKQPT